MAMVSYSTGLRDKSLKTNATQRNTQSIQFRDKRGVASTQAQIQNTIDNSPRVVRQQAKTDALSSSPIQKKENKTGLPDQLKSGIEKLSGMDMGDTRVHYNSNKPAQLNAHAYAQGTDIHLASGQEQHIAHEAWHVVQQKQGRVKPTTQLKEKTLINDDERLEREADVMGARALQTNGGDTSSLKQVSASGPIQRYAVAGRYKVSDDGTFAFRGAKKSLFAIEKQIDASNKMLKLSGGKGSLINLGKGEDKTVGDVPMKKVEPSLDQVALDRHGQYSHHKNLTAKNQNRFKLWRDCERASEAVTGTEDHENRRTTIADTGASHGLTVGGSRNALKNDTAHSLTAQVYMFNLGSFLKEKEEEERSTYIDLTKLKANDYTDSTFASTKDDATRALRIYNALLPAAKEAFDKFAKINDYALPEVGDSYVISSEIEMPGFDDGGRAWQFHWGGVIMKGGNDVATLESESSGDSDDIDSKWHFGLNGSKKTNGTINGDSFDKIHRATGLHGNKTTTIAVTNVHTPTDARTFAREDYPAQLNGVLIKMEASDAEFQNLNVQWDVDYTSYLQRVDEFLDDASRLKDFQKNVIRAIRTELLTLKSRRDALEDDNE